MTETSTEYETQPDAFAVGIATAQAALDSATEQHRAAQAHEHKIQARIKVLADERSAILKARERITTDQDDEKAGARLALIGADMERLNELLVPATEAVRQAGQGVAVATSRLREACAEQERYVAAKAAQALEAKLRELEGLFCRGLAELGRLKREAGGGRDILHGAQIFQPAAALTRFIVGGQVPQL